MSDLKNISKDDLLGVYIIFIKMNELREIKLQRMPYAKYKWINLHCNVKFILILGLICINIILILYN